MLRKFFQFVAVRFICPFLSALPTLAPPLFIDMGIFLSVFVSVGTTSSCYTVAEFAGVRIFSMIFFSDLSIVALSASSVILLKLFSFISFAQYVSVFAMSFQSVRASRHIFSVGNRFKMSRVPAEAITTQMVNLQTFWCNFYKYLICEFIFIPHTFFESNAGVSCGAKRCDGFPTRNAFEKVFRTDCDFREKSRKRFTVSVDSIKIVFSHYLLLFSRFWLGLESACNTCPSRFYILPQPPISTRG